MDVRTSLIESQLSTDMRDRRRFWLVVMLLVLMVLGTLVMVG